MNRIDVTDQAADLAEEEATEITEGETVIALCRTNDGLFAVDGICTHATASLAEGFILDKYIECPLHQAQFDLSNGQRVSGPECESLKAYRVVEADGRVFIELPPA